ncbi:MAG: YIP1 family protein [Bacteroidales bacterium]|jgi:hypothetical protein|nr:YIP1 family protein [Bacteroidales bacterium]
MTNLISRAKDIMFSPKTEWLHIEEENSSHAKVFMSYLLPLALIPTVAAFIGYGLIGYKGPFGIHIHSIEWGVRQAIIQFISMAGGAYLTAIIINLLAGTFNSRTDFNKAFSLVAYSYTPMMLGGIFYIYPTLSWLASLLGIYGLYLLFIGLTPMMQTPTEKRGGYFVVSLICMVAVAIVLSLILTAILISSAYKILMY